MREGCDPLAGQNAVEQRLSSRAVIARGREKRRSDARNREKGFDDVRGPDGLRKGGQVGHTKAERKLLPPDAVVPLKPTHCGR